jgi:hypothetical protein
MRSTHWGLLLCFASILAAAQPAPPDSKPLVLNVTPTDTAAVEPIKRNVLHILPPAGHRARRETVADAGQARPAAVTSATPPIRIISTLTNQGGPVMEHAVQHAVYLLPDNRACPTIAACWGNPEQFLHDLNRSEYIHVTDQYVGTQEHSRYPVGVSGSLTYKIPAKPLTDADIQAVVHAMVALDGGLSGYHHEYHVFLPPGQDECFDSTFATCASNAFCAYHSSADFKDVGHVIYSVEPFANVPGCSSLQPDGSSPSSQNSILSHEMIESITDPDGDAWWNATGDLDLFGFEIADECQWINFVGNNAGFLLDPVYLNGRLYFIQSEYNNHFNGCTDGPFPEF